MSNPFLGEIRLLGFAFAPAHWAFCTGQILNVTQNAALFSLLQNVFGGDGTTTFALPDLAGQMICGAGTGPNLTPRAIGQNFGTAAVLMVPGQMPSHSHVMGVYQNGTRAPDPGPMSALSTSDQNSIYVVDSDGASLPLIPTSVGGNNMPHENRQPFLAINMSISLTGVYPSGN
jgi:microcystin-dependent protein